MKNKKLLTGSLVGLAGLSATVAPLVSMTSCGKTVNLEKYDEIYGVDKFVYNTLELEFQNKINEAINASHLSQLEKDRAKTRTGKAVEIFRQQLTKFVGDANTKDIAYTTITNSMIDYAENEWGVKLNRNTKATMSDIDKLYNGLYDSWKANMKNNGMSPTQIAAILDDASHNFIEVKKTLTTKYTDALAALIKAKRLMAVVFADVNKDIGLLAASIRLQDFLENYVVAYNENGTDNKLDQLQGDKDFKVGADLTNYMGRIFTLTNAHTGEPVDFSNDLIPGYKITPRLDKIETNTKTNQHSIAIDWSCVKATYTGETAEQTTAHLFKPNQATLLRDIRDGKTVTDIFNADNKMTMSYSIPKTDAAVQKDLETTWTKKVDGQNQGETALSFKWDHKDGKPHLCAYEAFLRGAKFGADADYDYYYVSEQDLADSGLMFSTDGENFIRLDALNRSSGNTRALEKEELLDNLPLENRHFIDGCNITATVKIKRNDENHEAVVQLHYTYSNLELDPTKTNGQVKVDVSIDPSETSGFPFSSDGMTQVLNQYNKAKWFHNTYKNNVFQQDLDAMHSEKVLQDVVMGLTAAFDSIILATALIPVGSTPLQKTAKYAWVITSGLDLAVQVASYSLFRHFKWDVVNDYAERADEFTKTDEYNALNNMLDEDKNDYGLIDSEEDGGTDGDLFDKMFTEGDETHQAWSTLPSEDIEKLLNHYSPWRESTILHNYREKASEYNLDVDAYREELKGWEKGGKWDNMITGFTLTSFGILAIQLILGCIDPEVFVANEAKQPVEAELEVAKKTSLSLFQRTVALFKSLYQGTKDFFKTIKNCFQARKFDKFLELSKRDDVVKYIMNNSSKLIRGSADPSEAVSSPLFTIAYRDATVPGRFKDGRTFLEGLEEVMPCASKIHNVADLSYAEKIAQGNKDKIMALYDYCRKAGCFVTMDDKAAKEFESFEQLKEFFAGKIDEWRDLMGATADDSKDLLLLDDIDDMLYDTSIDSSFINCLTRSLQEIARVNDPFEDLTEIWSIFFIRG